MIVLSSKYKKLNDQHKVLKLKYKLLLDFCVEKESEIGKLKSMLQHQHKPTDQFTHSELKSLIQLCHPDKHNGKESAIRMTQKLVELSKLTK